MVFYCKRMVSCLSCVLLLLLLCTPIRFVVGKDESCSVINFKCGDGQTLTDGQTTVRQVGSPGKRGPAGEAGTRGSKGMKGNRGDQGKPGKDADLGRVRANVAQNLGVRNCQDVKDFLGVETTGYYLMRDPASMNAIYVLCDFKVRTGISTCKNLAKTHRVRESGFYWIKPVGFKEAFQVYCNFTNKEVKTEIWHDLMRETKLEGCEGRGCSSAIPEYNIEQKQILKIINDSQTCRQYINLRCIGVVLIYESHDPRAWWVSRDGEKMMYWGGAKSKRIGYCRCGETDSCINKKYKCNCDNNNGAVPTSDDGYLTDMTKLPVREMRFGDAGDASEHGWHTLGQLECEG